MATEITPSLTSSTLPIFDQLYDHSLNHKVEEMEKHASKSIHIMGRLALKGQITVFFAEPSTGKTLLSLALIKEAIANSAIGKHVFHVNLDDNYIGLIQKAHLGKRYGFQTISSETFEKPRDNLETLVDISVEDGSAKDAVLLLDTVKKFTNVMDKTDSSNFMNTCRKFTQAGGTIIALSHTNKKRDGEGKPVPSGTSDLKDDCDCAYTMHKVDQAKDQDGNTNVLVELNEVKSKGDVVQQATYQYTKFADNDYERMFDSVKLIDGNEADKLRAEKARSTQQIKDQPIIDEVVKLLQVQGTMNTKDIVSMVPSSCSRRKTEQCLKHWSGPKEDGAFWSYSKGAHNSSEYTLH